MADQSKKRRSAYWYGGKEKSAWMHRSWMKNQGMPEDAFDGRPVIGICNTWSELTPCNAHFRDLAERIKRGVLEAGGFPVEFPVMSVSESQFRPTAMLFRNLAAMDVEETIRAAPLDGVVLMAGCDKTTPSLMMGAASCDLPTIVVSGGPMLNGRLRGKQIGSGTAVWQLFEDRKANRIGDDLMSEAEQAQSRSPGFCMTMGTASTMASLVEALGMALPENAAIPAVDSRRNRLAQLSGRRIVEMVNEDMKMSKVLTREAFENAIRANGAIGGSTNAVIHLIALARRIGVDLGLDDWDKLGRDIPTLVDLMPSGRFLMEDFYYAGGLPVVLRALGEQGKLHRDAVTVNGQSIWSNVSEAENYNSEVIREWDNPLTPQGGLAILRGNLAPRGAVLKSSAASPHLFKHTGRAIVFDAIEEYHARIDDPDLDVDENCILVLRNCGPKGYPGMAEVGNMALPRKLIEKGVRDMIRISDARMSGTAYGTVILHVAPEAAAGGPLALVREGDTISVDVENRSLTLNVAEDELAKRAEGWEPKLPHAASAWRRMYIDHVTQADEGCDLDLHPGVEPLEYPRPSH